MAASLWALCLRTLRFLEDEGAIFTGFILVRDELFRKAEHISLNALMKALGFRRLPGASDTRNLHDNLSDSRAHVVANGRVDVGRLGLRTKQNGIKDVEELGRLVIRTFRNKDVSFKLVKLDNFLLF
jgi:hypothetical protein